MVVVIIVSFITGAELFIFLSSPLETSPMSYRSFKEKAKRNISVRNIHMQLYKCGKIVGSGGDKRQTLNVSSPETSWGCQPNLSEP